MTPQTISVTPSMTLHAIRTDRHKTGVLTLTLPLPLSSQSTAYHILLAGIMRRGTQKYPSIAAINRRLDDLYATDVEVRSTKIGKNLLLTMTAEMLDNRYVPTDEDLLDGVLEVIADLLFHPLLKDGCFDEEATRQEIRCAIDALDAEINNTRAYAMTRCVESMYRNDPDFPTVAKLREIILGANGRVLYEHYRNLIQNAPIDVFYIGSLAPEEVADKLLRALSDAPTTQSFVPLPLVAAKAGTPISQTQTMPVAQGKLAMGFRTGVCAAPDSDAHYQMLLLNELFGGSPASKLFMNVREKMSLCYYCSSSYSIYTGDMMVSSGIEVRNREVAEAAIREQFTQIQRGNVTEAEFSAAKKSLQNCYRQLYDNPLDLQTFLGTRHLFGISETVEECCQRLSTVRLEDVIAISQDVVCDTVFFVEGTHIDAEEEAFDEE